MRRHGWALGWMAAMGGTAFLLAGREGMVDADERVSSMLAPGPNVLGWELGVGPEPLLFGLQAALGACLFWLGYRGLLGGGK